MALKVFKSVEGFERSSSIFATTIRFLAERLSFCTTSELDTNFELQTRSSIVFVDAHNCVVQNTLVMYACAYTPVGLP
eukprot:12751332-Heterocapsa_arctica.AAC.1